MEFDITNKSSNIHFRGVIKTVMISYSRHGAAYFVDYKRQDNTINDTTMTFRVARTDPIFHTGISSMLSVLRITKRFISRISNLNPIFY